MFTMLNYPNDCLRFLRHSRGFGGRASGYALGQQGRRCNQDIAPCCTESRLRHPMVFVNLYGESRVRAANQRGRTSCKAWFIRVANVSRMQEMTQYIRHCLLKLPATLAFVKNSPNQLRFQDQ